jgi:hypothetical protein
MQALTGTKSEKIALQYTQIRENDNKGNQPHCKHKRSKSLIVEKNRWYHALQTTRQRYVYISQTNHTEAYTLITPTAEK